MHFVAQKFAYVGKKLYLCAPFVCKGNTHKENKTQNNACGSCRVLPLRKNTQAIHKNTKRDECSKDCFREGGIRKDNGYLIRTIGNGDAVDADFNSDQTLVIITTSKGKVEIRKDNGYLVRTIGNGDAVSARWNGSDVAIRTTKGKTELRKDNGYLIRTI